MQGRGILFVKYDQNLFKFKLLAKEFEKNLLAKEFASKFEVILI
jgi:hypothetical protein